MIMMLRLFIICVAFSFSPFYAGAATNFVARNDFDGDGASDLAIYHPARGNWYIISLAGKPIAYPKQWGYPTAEPVPADYDGDGIADLAVYDRNGGYWYVLSMSGRPILWGFQWGWNTAIPVPGDYDGDGAADLGVYDQNTAHWFVYSPKKRRVLMWYNQWGFKGDTRRWEKRPYPLTVLPMPFDYDQDGRTDQGIYYRGVSMDTSAWYVKGSSGKIFWRKVWGSSGSIGAPGNYIQHYPAFTDYPPGISTYKIGSKTATPEWGTPYVLGDRPGFGIFMGQFGRTLPVPNQDVDGNGWDDYILYDYTTGEWTIKLSSGDGSTLRNGAVRKVRHGFSGARPANIYSTIYHSSNYQPAPW